MKKIDLHIHTIKTISDSDFEFSIDVFKEYVEQSSLDAVAVTNHNIFDINQFRLIQEKLGIVVFPGIEINMDKGHVLIIGNSDELDDFEAKANIVSQRITKIGDELSFEELIEIYKCLNKYLIIPHYDKRPHVLEQTLEKLRPFISAGEVESPKKFVRAIKDKFRPTPVLFSDCRMKVGLERFPTRQTYIDCGQLTIESLKLCLQDKRKVTLSKSDGNELWQVFENGQKLSTGLNILIGARSSGKTHMLNEISKYFENDKSVESIKYIKQFSLVQHDEANSDRQFKKDIELKRSGFVDNYLSGLKRTLDEIMKIDLAKREKELERYIETLLKSAKETDRTDAFSKATLFDEVSFPVGNKNTLESLIQSIRQIIENIDFRAVIEKYVCLQSLKKLAVELIEILWGKQLEDKKKEFVNSLLEEVRNNLHIRTSATQIEDVDIYEICMDNVRVRKFEEIVSALKNEAVIFEESIQGFRVEARREKYNGAGEIKSASGVKTAFGDAFQNYQDPYKYLRQLMENDSLSQSDLYKLFVKINYRVLNEDGFEVSGGERSEYRLLQEISDAQKYEVLLIDEPESSFDNVFLNSNVNQILRDISNTMPVVVVTHNSTVGASVEANYILHTMKVIEKNKAIYRVYSGYPTDKQFYSVDGLSINSHEVMLNSLEAGAVPYDLRRKNYEAIKN